ncbi:hypothetical protein MKW98_024378 [Papaver atlanticum]|uniref:non-specific serine/threonine protein kinase n=1 Tax=Papaver atlanticum TaxID=357466 RepID=A0AAD4XPM3_9MAGN|nr:hypothetical protein MKW98_024378 [Papaver atlanticum]
MSTNTTSPPVAAPVPTSPPTTAAPPPDNSTASASPPAPTATVPPPATSPPSTVPPPTGSPPADASPPAPAGGGGGGTSPSPPSPPSTPTTPGSTVTPTAPSGSSSPSGGTGRSPPSNSNPTTPSSPSPSGSKVNTGLISGIVIGGVVVLVIVGFLFLFFKKKKRRDNRPSSYYVPPPGPKGSGFGGQPQQWQNTASPPPADHFVSVAPKPTPPPPRPPHSPARFPPPSMPPQPFMSSSGGSGSNYSESANPYPPPSPGMSLGFSKSTFTYEELKMATNGFSDANLLGQGGFGYVHKGVLPNGTEVAVKSLKAGSGQGEREFQAEVEIISRVHHRHLVSLVGYCMVGDKRMLVYEFVPNNTLEFHLHGKGRPTMDWSTRLKIALGSAKGLAYLHEDCHPKIIHRDIKAANILIDFKFEAQVADFGLAKIASDTNTHVSTRVMGTFGYLAPEYASSGKLSDKSDVFSFGVMLLELITGRRPVDSNQSYMDDSLVDWVSTDSALFISFRYYVFSLVFSANAEAFNPNSLCPLNLCDNTSVHGNFSSCG